MTWSGRYRSESRQTPVYRSGRIFLAGDAAHTHSPAGAQGMNTGLQDAVNLGWKLAAAEAGWAPDWLLDSYQAERHPVGAAVLSLAGRQFRLNTAQTAPRRALRWAVQRVVAPLPPVQTRLARGYSGLAIRYPQAAAPGRPAAAGAAHPLAGTRLPRGHVTGPDGSPTRLYDLFHDGRFVLLEADDAGTGGAGAGGAEGAGGAARPGLPDQVRQVRYVRAGATRLPSAALVRPDGYLAWASDERDGPARAAAARAAVRWWCG
jgi:hypothetical protein